MKKIHKTDNQKVESPNELYDFGTKLSNDENDHRQNEQAQLLSSHSISQLDSITLLAGNFSNFFCILLFGFGMISWLYS